MAGPRFRNVPRRVHFSGLELAQVVIAGGLSAGSGVLFLSREAGSATVRALSLLLLVTGLIALVVAGHDLITRSSSRFTERTGVWELPPAAQEAAAQSHLGPPLAAHPASAAGHVLALALLPPLAWLAVLMTILYSSDGSSGLATGAAVVAGAAIAGTVRAWRARRDPAVRRWVVFDSGLMVVSPDGLPERVVRWDHVTGWHEMGYTNESTLPYQLHLSILDEEPFALRGKEVSAVHELRDRVLAGLRRPPDPRA